MQRRQPAHRLLLIVVALLLVPMLSCEWFASRGPTISDVVLARDVKLDTLDPVEITDVYSQDQPEFHAVIGLSNAPLGTRIKAIWTALDVGNAAPQNTIVNQSEKKAEGTQNVHFSVTPDFGRWPPGLYKLDLYLNDELYRTLDFKVDASLRAKSVLLVCPPLPPPSLKSFEIVMSVTMALGVQEEDKEPIGGTTVFPSSAIFHAVVLVVEAPKDTIVTATWYATDLGELSSCNTKLLTTDIIVDDTRNIDFSLTSKIPWPDGEYRVEISVDGALAQVVPFEVSSKTPSTTAPTRQP